MTWKPASFPHLAHLIAFHIPHSSKINADISISSGRKLRLCLTRLAGVGRLKVSFRRSPIARGFRFHGAQMAAFVTVPVTDLGEGFPAKSTCVRPLLHVEEWENAPFPARRHSEFKYKEIWPFRYLQLHWTASIFAFFIFVIFQNCQATWPIIKHSLNRGCFNQYAASDISNIAIVSINMRNKVLYSRRAP